MPLGGALIQGSFADCPYDEEVVAVLKTFMC